MFGQTKQLGRRFRTQLQKVKKKSAATTQKTYSIKPKSTKRREAGTIKAALLAVYHQDFRAARQALKNEGYKGSLKMKKGMAMHTKIAELRKARAAGGSSASGSSGIATAGSVSVMNVPK